MVRNSVLGSHTHARALNRVRYGVCSRALSRMQRVRKSCSDYFIHAGTKKSLINIWSRTTRCSSTTDSGARASSCCGTECAKTPFTRRPYLRKPEGANEQHSPSLTPFPPSHPTQPLHRSLLPVGSLRMTCNGCHDRVITLAPLHAMLRRH